MGIRIRWIDKVDECSLLANFPNSCALQGKYLFHPIVSIVDYTISYRYKITHNNVENKNLFSRKYNLCIILVQSLLVRSWNIVLCTHSNVFRKNSARENNKSFTHLLKFHVFCCISQAHEPLPNDENPKTWEYWTSLKLNLNWINSQHFDTNVHTFPVNTLNSKRRLKHVVSQIFSVWSNQGYLIIFRRLHYRCLDEIQSIRRWNKSIIRWTPKFFLLLLIQCSLDEFL